MPNCVTCDTHIAKLYRCSSCEAPYCTARCYKIHKAEMKCDDMKKKDAAPDASAETASVSSSHEKLDVRAAAREALQEEGCDELVVLDEVHLVALAHDKTIRDQLKTEELRKLLRIVNNSRSRLDALDAAIHNVPEFKEFCLHLLQVIDAAQCGSR